MSHLVWVDSIVLVIAAKLCNPFKCFVFAVFDLTKLCLYVTGFVLFGAWFVRKAVPMASSAPSAGPANSGGGEQRSNHLPSSSDSPVSPAQSETPISSRQRYFYKMS